MEENESPTEVLARQAWARQDFETAATIVYEGYGRELYSFLLAQFPNTASADDVFSQFSEDFWRGLPGFGWRCSIRAWCYQVVRNAANRHRRAPHNDKKRHTPLSQSPWVDAALQSQRTNTRPHQQTEVKNEFQRLRERLAPEEQELLILRVDRNLSWHEVAHAMLGLEQSADEAQVRKKEAALRQRYTELKKRLRELATEAGLLGSDDGDR
jgi:RNA polymerase sigma-70 factor (ECF subfamily)